MFNKFNKKIFLSIVLSCTLLIAFFISLSACNRGIRPRPARAVQDNNDRDTSSRRNNDRNDNDDRRSSGDSSLAGGGDCSKDDDCEEYCDELFTHRDATDDCLDLSVDEVEAIYDAFEEDNGFLAEPDGRNGDLDDVQPEAIELAQEIEDDIWTDLIDDYTRGEAEDVMEWMAEDSAIFAAVTRSLEKDKDVDSFLEKLLKRFQSNVETALTEEIGYDAEPEETFMYRARDNRDLLEFTHAVLLQNCSGSYSDVSEEVDEESACSLGEVYCKQDDDDNYIFEDVFEEIVQSADRSLQDYIEADSGTNKVQGLEVDDDDSTDIEVVCEALCHSTRFGKSGRRAATCSS